MVQVWCCWWTQRPKTVWDYTCVSVSVCVYVSVSGLMYALIMGTGRNSKKLFISAVYRWCLKSKHVLMNMRKHKCVKDTWVSNNAISKHLASEMYELSHVKDCEDCASLWMCTCAVCVLEGIENTFAYLVNFLLFEVENSNQLNHRDPSVSFSFCFLISSRWYCPCFLQTD